MTEQANQSGFASNASFGWTWIIDPHSLPPLLKSFFAFSWRPRPRDELDMAFIFRELGLVGAGQGRKEMCKDDYGQDRQ